MLDRKLRCVRRIIYVDERPCPSAVANERQLPC
jgi:hypothetical protein